VSDICKQAVEMVVEEGEGKEIGILK